MKTPFGDLIKGDTPVLVDFYADWCGPCKQQAPALKQLAGRMGEKLRIIKIDIDKSRVVSTKFQIQSVPTLILFHKGKIVWRKSGVQSLQTLEGLVNQVLA